MEDFSDLASRIGVSVGDLRGCIVLSRDGLVIGAYPEDGEAIVKPAWLRFTSLGDPVRGFVEFGDEIWAYANRGPYAMFAVAPATVRPGLLLDQLEQGLLVAEEARAKREGLRVPEAVEAPKGKPRTPLHPEQKGEPAPEEPISVVAAVAEPDARSEAAPDPATPSKWDELAGVADQASAPAAAASDVFVPPRDTSPTSAGPTDSESSKTSPTPGPAAPEPAPGSEEPPAASDADRPDAASDPAPKQAGDDGEVDRVLLAQEFSRLLQETEADDDDEG